MLKRIPINREGRAQALKSRCAKFPLRSQSQDQWTQWQAAQDKRWQEMQAGIAQNVNFVKNYLQVWGRAQDAKSKNPNLDVDKMVAEGLKMAQGQVDPPHWYSGMSSVYKMPNNPRYMDLWVECQTSIEDIGRSLWRKRFFTDIEDPIFVTSKRLGVPTERMRKSCAYREVQGKTYWWGIVVSFNAYLNTPKKNRERWLTNLLKHELVHYAGYWHHKKAFWDALKAIGGSN